MALSADNAKFLEKINQSITVNPSKVQIKKPSLTFTGALKPPVLNKPLSNGISLKMPKKIVKPSTEVAEVNENAEVAKVNEDTTTEVTTQTVISVDHKVGGSEDVGNPLNADIVIEEANKDTEANEIVDTPEVNEVTEVNEVKKPKRRGRKKKQIGEPKTEVVVEGETVSAVSLVANESDQHKFVYSMPKTELDLQSAIKELNVDFVDDDWTAEKESIIKKISEVVISDDMNQAVISVALTQLSHIRDEIWLNFNNSRTVCANLSRPGRDNEGLIDRVRTLNSTGSNDLERRKNGIMAVMNYKTTDGQNINMYDILNVMTTKYYFYRDVMNQIQFKVDCLKGLSYGLGIDAKLTPYTEG